MLFKLIQSNRDSNNTVRADHLWKKILELPEKDAKKKGKHLFIARDDMVKVLAELEKDNCVMYSSEDGNVVLI